MDLAEIGLPDYELWIDDETQQPEIWSNKRKKWLSLCLTKGYKHPIFCIDGKTKRVLLHQIVAKMCIPNPEGFKEIDHINNNRTDNRIENLRWVSPSTNNRNKLWIKGYSWNKRDRKWASSIHINGKRKHLGNFDTEAEARAAYVAAMNLFFPNVRDFGDEVEN
jgi:hypothetical protein